MPQPPSTANEIKPATIAFGSVWKPPYQRLTVGLILVALGAAFEALAVATILPKTVADLGGLNLYGWTFSAYMLADLIGIVIAGDLADRRGPGQPLIIGVSFFVVGLALGGLAPTMLTLVLARAVQGFGAGIISAIIYVCIGQGYPETARPRMLAILATAWVVPGLVSPALAAVIANSFGWRWIFLGLIPLPLIATVLILPSLKHFASPTKGKTFDWRRLLAVGGLVLGTGMILTGLGITSILIALVLILPGLALAGPTLRFLLPAGTLRARAGLPAAIATLWLLHLAYFGAESFLPLMLIAIRNQSLLFAGLVLTPAVVSWTCGSWLQARLTPRQSRRLLITAGLLLIFFGLVGVAVVLIPGVPVIMALISWGVAGLGMGLAFDTLTIVVLEAAAPAEQGSASAALQLAAVLGTALGPGIGGSIIALFAVPGRPPLPGMTIIDVLFIVTICISLLTATRLPGKPPQLS